MKKGLLRRGLSMLLAFAMLLTVLPSPVWAATTVTIRLVDEKGDPVSVDTDDISVVAFWQSVAVSATSEAGVYQYTVSSRRSATITINAAGYEAYSGSISRNSTDVTITLTSAGPEYVTFKLFYYIGGADNTFPPSGYAAAGSSENYGPSGDDTPFAEITVNITALQERTDAVKYVTGQSGNNWHFVPLLENDVESARVFWQAVLDCTTEESIEILQATGLSKEFVGYCLKDQRSAYHADGILAENPPVYVVELHAGGEFTSSGQYQNGTYVGGSITGENGDFPTMAEELTALEGYLGYNITWVEDSNGNPIAGTDSSGRRTYSGTYVLETASGIEVHSITVTQLNYASASAVEGTDILYQEVGEYYHLAQFAITTEKQHTIVSYSVTYTDGVANSELFYDHEYGANAGDPVPAFPATPAREGYTFQGWLLNTDSTVYSSEQIASMTVQQDMVFQAVWLAIPKYTGTVEVILDGTYDSTTGIATGTRVDVTDLAGEEISIHLHPDGSDEHIPLQHTGTGIYSAELENGNYGICSYNAATGTYYHTGDQFLTIENQDRTRYLFFNTVTYDANGGSGAPGQELYMSGSAVTVSSTVPSREGYLFDGWLCDDTLFQPGDSLVGAIYLPRTLTAQWTKAEDVYVTIIINHMADEDHVNNDKAKHDITFTLDTRESGSAGDYTEIFHEALDWDGSAEFTHAHFSASFDSEQQATTYTAHSPVLEGVAANMEYTFTTSKSGYVLQSVTQEKDENGNLQIVAKLVYDPQTFDLLYSVRLDEESKALPDAYKPVAVNVKVTAWYDTPFDEDYNQANTAALGWYTVSSMRYTYERILLDATGEGFGTYPVAIQTTDGDFTYHYRIEVVSYELADGTILKATDDNNDHTTYVSDGKRYYATVYAAGGATPNGSPLSGVYYDGQAQAGTLEAVVSIPVFTVTYDPNGGLLNGDAASLTVTDLLVVPGKDAYIPTRDGSYVFDGWYLADGTEAPYGTDLVKDITLTAKWKAPLTVEGMVTVAGSYEMEGENGTTIQHIPNTSRPTEAMVLLQKIDPNGYTETLRETLVYLDYSDEAFWFTDELGTRHVGYATYAFTQIPDDGTNYRIQLLIPNYISTFQNEPASVADPRNYPSYTLTNYEAVLGDQAPSVAVVNIHSHFAPESFPLLFQVDASAIGEGFRPDSAQVLITCKTDPTVVHPSQWEVISQMVFGQALQGAEVALANGLGQDTLDAWKTFPDGTTLYDYGLRLQSLTFNGVKTAYTENDHYTVSYISPAHYVTGGQSQELVVTLTPKEYTIRYEPNGGTLFGTHTHTHVWSQETTLETVTPLRTGYAFGGWYTDAELTQHAPATIAADVAQDTVFYAKWLGIDNVQLTAYIDHTDLDEGTTGSYSHPLTVQLTQRLRGSDGAFAAVDGQQKSYDSSYWHTHGDEVTQDVMEAGNVFYHLSTDYDYSLDVSMEGYTVSAHSVEKITHEDGSTTHHVTVHLAFGVPTVVFHVSNEKANGGEDVFRIYCPSQLSLPEGKQYFSRNTDGTITPFCDLPQFSYEDHNDYIFMGWYYDDGTPLDWNAAYTTDTHVYARWIETGTVAQETDGKMLPADWNGYYHGFDLVGIQVRTAERDEGSYSGTAGSGLRFITVMKETVWQEICGLSENAPEYGFVMAKKAALGEQVQDADFRLELGGSNTITLKCSGYTDHFSGEAYRLYTGVVTYKSAAAQGEEVLAKAHASEMVARSYIRYTDANGMDRTYYNNYISKNQVGGGCSASYDMALSLIQNGQE